MPFQNSPISVLAKASLRISAESICVFFVKILGGLFVNKGVCKLCGYQHPANLLGLKTVYRKKVVLIYIVNPRNPLM